MKVLNELFIVLFMGVLMGCGIKLVNWTWPDPPIQFIHKVDEASKCLQSDYL